MATWAIGDVQGCRVELEQLLERIAPTSDDRLWFTGDLVNRGPDSLGVLRLVRSLGEQAVTVLGNHDLHLIAVAAGTAQSKRRDTLDDVLGAMDREPLLEWLRHRPVLHHDQALCHTLVHAGLPPDWDLDTAISCARELESALRGPGYREFLERMYGDRPSRWSDELRGVDRLRYIVNALTRMRLLGPAAELQLDAKGGPEDDPSLTPWYCYPGARWQVRTRVVAGHWSTLGLDAGARHLCLDGGCVWGGDLVAVRLEDGETLSLGCPGAQSPG